MNLSRFALRNIFGNAFRSWVVALCALLVSGFAFSTTLVMRGAEDSLRLAIDRLGADVVVVPQGSETKVESALLMGTAASAWMPEQNLQKVSSIAGVAAASPQIYLSTLHDAACCSVADMFLVAYDPSTDFTVRPWLKQKLGKDLGMGDVVGGSHVFVPAGEENIKIYGYLVTLKGNLEPTGTGLDQTMFMTLQTAQDVARKSKTNAVEPLDIPTGRISAIMVKLAPASDSHDVAVKIIQDVPGVTPIESPNLFKAYRNQMSGLLSVLLVVLGFTWVLSLVLIGLVFSMAANERRRELGVLRALGSTRRFLLQSLLAEAGILALLGGAIGLGLATLVIYLFRNLIVRSLGVPFLLPSVGSLLLLLGVGLVLALITVGLAAMIPAYKISRQDPATAMRE